MESKDFLNYLKKIPEDDAIVILDEMKKQANLMADRINNNRSKRTQIMSRFERKCKCKANMEYVGGMGGDGRFWCPKCGTYSQSYVCEPTVWKRPCNLPEAKASDVVLDGRFLKSIAKETIKKCKIECYGWDAGNTIEGDYGTWKQWENVLIKYGKEILKNVR